MTKSMRTHVRALVLFLGAVFLLSSGAQLAQARHNDGGYSSSVARKIRSLDDDIVKSFAIPILFGVELSDLFPNFGDPRDGGARTHEGLDIMGVLGTPIVSPTEAVVVRTGEGDSAGKYVYTANPGGETFRYMHLDDIADIRTGDELEVGDYIGTVGDTGNAQGGPAHLHLEVREGDAKDPYDRIEKEFTLKDKMEFVVSMFKDLDDEEEMAEFLVEEYTNEFKTALNAGYELPDEIERELKKRGIVSVADLVAKLDAIIKTIPTVVTTNLVLGSEGTSVSLVQMYLIYEGKGPAADALKATGATGYFGPVTQQALFEYQGVHGLEPTGIYDAQTRQKMADQ